MNAWQDYFTDLGHGLPLRLPDSGPDNWATGLGEMVDWVKNLERSVIGEGTHIHPSAVLEGPVWIGSGCQIGPHAYLRPGTMLGDGCVVGHGAEIKASVCMGGSKIQHAAFVGDSILGRGARVASGVIVANRRFDQGPVAGQKVNFLGGLIGDWARLGANASCAPGTLVGSGTWIGGGVHAHGHIPPRQLVLLRQDLRVSPLPGIQLGD